MKRIDKTCMFTGVQPYIYLYQALHQTKIFFFVRYCIGLCVQANGLEPVCLLRIYCVKCSCIYGFLH